MYADIIIDITHEKLDKVFQYSIPSGLEGMLKVGMAVQVPFGAGNRERIGYIVGFSHTCQWDPAKIKEILSAASDHLAIEARLVALAAWIREHYGGTMVQALRVVLPIKKKQKAKEKRQLHLLLNLAEGQALLKEYCRKSQTARARLLEALLEDPVLQYDLVTSKLNISAGVVKALEERGVLSVETQTVYRNPLIQQDEVSYQVAYTPEQQEVIRMFKEDYAKGRWRTYLLHGITGSGKTEIYMEAIFDVVRRGRQAIVLIPEIALTYQTVMRFYRRFGERVSIMNSRMSAGERYDQTMRAKNGDIDIMIGPRSALFTPFPDLGLIIIDEEHEGAYKSEQIPRYHARETAIARAGIEQASVILGSATPSVEAFYRGQSGEYQLCTLKHRVQDRKLPLVHTVDMRQELEKGNRSILSDTLRELITDRLTRHQQIMLFINRRGYAGFISCRSCGYVVKCPHCDVSLTEHRGNRLICHYCGYEQSKTSACPSCGSPHIGGFKAGTQQIEEMIKKEFPEAKVLRMDKDTTKEKNGHEKILSQFANAEGDILIGTQMIVKGHDFANVTLVGILAADLSLHTNDYRAGERTFQLLTQAAGRAGRGEQKGEVVIQTYSPQHYSIVSASAQDYQGFYREEMSYRALMGYPPAEHLLAVLISAGDDKILDQAAHFLSAYARRLALKREGVQVIGPALPYVTKIQDIYRKITYIKCPEYDTLIVLKDHLEEYIDMNEGFHKTSIQFDFNPMNIF